VHHVWDAWRVLVCRACRDLSSRSLTGTVPSELVDLTQLSGLYACREKPSLPHSYLDTHVEIAAPCKLAFRATMVPSGCVGGGAISVNVCLHTASAPKCMRINPSAHIG
jgi:hypothetical protein